mmetsp:Transcript_15403/g.13939  ORF Transcript_15403/g.13939 Transcript_15403/m.13939 type:complete len:294 (+) Transcript_15403:3-884(+)
MLPLIEPKAMSSSSSFTHAYSRLHSNIIGDKTTNQRSNKNNININNNGSSMFLDSNGRFPEYLRRLCDIRQMDFESAFDQMITLLSNEPQKVYTSFYYRKQTKNQWARDDPAFAFVEACFVAIAALAYAIAFHHASIWGYIWAVLYAVLVDWLLIGVIIASILSNIANKNLRQHLAHTVEQEVEWLYAFDVHCNAYLCSFVITHLLQYFLLPLLLNRAILSCLLSNTLYTIASIWYFYVTHLGYRALPFLGNTQVFLWYPSVAIGFTWLLSTILLILGLRINLTRIIMAFHYG